MDESPFYPEFWGQNRWDIKKAIVEVGTDLLTVQNPLVDYPDGEVAILDNVKGLQNIDSMKLDLDAVILCTKGRIQLEMGVHPLLLHENDVIVCPHGGHPRQLYD